MKKYTLLFIVLQLSVLVSAQNTLQKKGLQIPPVVCYGSGKVERAAIPPSPEIMNALKSAGEKKSDIVVFYGTSFPENAKQAFEYAVSIWENIIESPIPIYVEANWRSLSDGVLGSCGPDNYFANFENAPHPNIYYPVALVEKLGKTEITGPETPDIVASFSSNVEWYFNTDLKTPDSLYDFVTVVLHEMAHGLGFTGFFFVEDGEGAYGYFDYGDAATFDLLVTKNNGDKLIDTTKYQNQSEELGDALVSNSLYNSSPVAITDGGGSKPRLYAPAIWDGGSSIYHLNDATYPTENPNSLMTHAIGKAEAVHDPGPITAGIMADLGWKHLFINFDELSDIETVQPLSFEVGLKSEFDLDTNRLFIISSTDNFQNEIDSTPLVAGSTETLFEAELTPALQTGTIQYYISAGDVKNRTFRLPTEAPENYYSITIGPDLEAPEITHNPITFYILGNDSLRITANVDDNLGIDTVFVEYSVNDLTQPPFALENESENLYSGVFKFETLLNDGDIISYRIIAIDGSAAKNTITEPRRNTHSFTAEGIYEPLEKYINSFDAATTDFVISEFKISTEPGFADGALHSQHPYPSPNKNDTEFNFSTILKHPIILKENGTITFDEVVLVEPGESYADFGDDEFWDYVIVEGSTDTGKTWLPLLNGYDSRSNTVWLTAYNQSIENQVSNAVGSSDMFVAREINILENGNFTAGDTILIRFRLFSDPFAHGWGWAIDNLRIQFPVTTNLTTLSPGNISVYPNPFYNELNISIESEKPVKNLHASIYNIYGQKVKTMIWENVLGRITETISLADLQNGMYLLTIQENGERISSRKILKSSN